MLMRDVCVHSENVAVALTTEGEHVIVDTAHAAGGGESE